MITKNQPAMVFSSAYNMLRSINTTRRTTTGELYM